MNKIWNAAKLVERSIAGKTNSALPATIKHPVNRWMLARLKALIELTDARLSAYSFNDASENIRISFWGEFCDFYLEAIKLEQIKQLDETPAVLLHTFEQYLRLFHPFIPFVTEEVWSQLQRPGMLIRAEWPTANAAHTWPEDAEGVAAVVRLLTEIRRIRSEKEIEQSAKVDVLIQPRLSAEIFEACREIIARLARTTDPVIEASPRQSATAKQNAVVAVDSAFTVAVSLSQADAEAERSRLTKQLATEQQRLSRLEQKLQDERFLQQAKPEFVLSTKAEAAKVSATIVSLQERLHALA